MLKQIKRWFEPPVFPDDEDKFRLAQILHTLLAIVLVFLLFATFGTIFIFVNKILSSALLFILLAWVLISYVMVQRGLVLAASRLLVVGLWIVFTFSILLTGRVNTTFASSHLAVIVMAGILLGRRSAVILTLLSTTVGLGLATLESIGYPLTHYFPMPPLAGWAVWVGAFILAIIPLTPTIQSIAQSTEALRESEMRFRSIYSQSPIAIELYDAEGNLTDVNPACLDLFGVTDVNDVKGFKLFEDPNVPKNAKKQLMAGKAVNYQAVFDFELVKEMNLYRTKKSGRCHLDCFITPWTIDKTAPSGFLVHIRDMTEHKKIETALIESQTKLSAIFNNSLDAILVSKAGLFVMVNPAFLQMHGYEDSSAVMGRSVLDLVAPESQEMIAENIRRRASGQSVPTFYEAQVLRRDGEKFWVELSLAPYELDGETYVLAIERDITERKQVEEREQEQHDLAEALSNSAAALNSTLNYNEVLDRVLDNVGRVVPHNAANIMLLDKDGDSLSIACHHGYLERGSKKDEIERQFSLTAIPNLIEAARNGQPLVIQNTHAHSDWIAFPATKWIQSYLTMPIQIRQTTVGFLNLDSETTGFFNLSHAERLQAFANHAAMAIQNAQLYQDMKIIAVTDALTGIYNRAFFETELARMELSRDFPVSIIVADLDNLKTTNDQLGHTAGDELIKNVAQILREIFRAADIIARIGGDEFAILLPNTNSEAANQMLSRVRAKLVEHNARHSNLPVELSLGTSTAQKGKLMEAFHIADERMYADKTKRKSSNIGHGLGY